MRRLVLLAIALLPASMPVAAQQAPQGRAARTPEPLVQRTVIEDDNARIEELRVRGQLRSVVVSPKLRGVRPYEIVPGDGSRDLTQSHASTRGASGQRVWSVGTF